MSTFALLSSVLALAALFGLVSNRVLRLPTTVGTMVLALLLSGGLLALDHVSSGVGTMLSHAASAAVGQLDFGQIVLHGMLAFLLFAAALHLDLEALHREKLTVAALAIVGTVLSTAIVAAAIYFTLPLLHIAVDPTFCLLFGALIAPTDPVAVLGMLRRVGAPPEIEMRLAGESLFNDGVGAALFLALLGMGATGVAPTVTGFLALFMRQAGGGLLLGVSLGYITYLLLRQTDNFRVEVTLTLALATGSYALADALHLSGPLSVIAAGVVVNGRASALSPSKLVRDKVDTFWEVLDELLNVILFLMLGLQLLAVPLRGIAVAAGLIAIPVVLLARFFSVGAVLGPLALWRTHQPGSLWVLTWAGLRGGLSVALALGLPQGPQRGLALAMTYMVVIFSMLVQGLTVGPLIRKLKLST
jgi:CPA1 family monovalent cation:H+ antiporter